MRRTVPSPGPGELLLRVEACGVCRTDLHLAEGDLRPHRASTVPGHEIVGRVAAVGESVTGFRVGDRAGGAWLRSTCGRCRYCRAGRENLCPASLYTGWDADGGFADVTLVPADYAHALPDDQDAVLLAPLLCAGIIGYRALRRSALPPNGRLGIYGFGASAHLAAQVALAEGATVHVLTRSARARELALDLGASSVGGAYDRPPEPLDSAILFAPVGIWCPWHWRHWTVRGRSPWRASISPTSPCSITAVTFSKSGICAASPPTPGRTAATSWTWPRGSVCGSPSARIR
ncbi:zinc-binding alcohol dehydrogenase family protein [Streptomyces sp. INA 01156]